MLKSNMHIYLLLYVDNMLIACKERAEIEALKQLLNTVFDMKDLGSGKKILVVEIIKNKKNSSIFLSQEKYLTRVLKTFGMLDCKLVQLPLATHFKLCKLYCPKTKEEREEMSNIPYANVVGCLMYAIVLARPDISRVVNVVSRYMASPDIEHWKGVKWILRYIRGTLGLGLLYRRNDVKGTGFWGFVDYDFVGDMDRRMSLTGYMFFF